MAQCLLDQSLSAIPSAGSTVQLSQVLAATALVQELLQQALEEMVQPIPAPALVQRYQKDVHALQPVQGGLHLLTGGTTPHERDTPLHREFLQNRGPHQ